MLVATLFLKVFFLYAIFPGTFPRAGDLGSYEVPEVGAELRPLQVQQMILTVEHSPAPG